MGNPATGRQLPDQSWVHRWLRSKSRLALLCRPTAQEIPSPRMIPSLPMWRPRTGLLGILSSLLGSQPLRAFATQDHFRSISQHLTAEHQVGIVCVFGPMVANTVDAWHEKHSGL